ncbi:MAG: hypothetical protein K2J79_04085, partial [Ruminiclostridium sp.]|nr:hypothetical protein [Ruminiclostridium sp.]
MKKRLVLLKSLSLTFIFALSLFLNGSTVYAAAAAGSTVGITALPATTQNEFYSILENILKSLFDTSSSRTITVTGEDGNQYTYDFNDAFDILQSKIDGNYDIVQAELGEKYPEVPDDVTFSLDYTFLNSLPAGLQIIFRPLLTHVCVLWYQSTVHTSSEGGLHGGTGRRRLSASDYSSAVNDILNEIYSSGSSSGISWGLDLINGVPHNSITVNQDYLVSVFDFLGLDYKMFTSPNNLVITTDVFDNTHLSTLYYTPFFITENNDLYILYKTVYQEYFKSKYSGICGQNRFYLGSEYYSASFDWEKTIKGYLSFRFFAQDTSLYLGVLSCYSSSEDKKNVHWNQYIISDPE